MLRTYELKAEINKGKEEKILSVLKEYRITAFVIGKKQWELFYTQGAFNKNHPVKGITSLLSERYKQIIQYQAVSILNSFISNRQNDFVRIVIRSNLSQKEKVELLYINKYKLWFNKKITIPEFNDKGKRIKKKKRLVDINTVKLARKIMKYILSHHRKPRFKYINMDLDNKVAVIEKKDKKRAKHFDYWIRFSTLEKNKPIYLPLKSNSYFEEIKGDIKKFCQINIDRDGNIKINLIKKKEKDRNYTPQTSKIALDLGLNNLFATDKGDLFGREFKKKLIDYDRVITNLQANLQKQKLKPGDSRRYRGLISKVRAYLKNEVRRIINSIINIYNPKEIIIEKLNFTSPNLSRRLNRILSKFGKKEIQKKFETLSKELSVKITYINPAYTSQECASCGYIDKNNRRGELFYCKLCNKKLHADVNGARTILKRSSLKEVSIYKSKKEVLHILMKRFLSNMEPGGRLYSKAKFLTLKNPYFKSEIKGFT